MGHIGIREIAVVAVVILLLYGAKKLPEIARSMGKSVHEFKKGVQGAADPDKGEEQDTPEKE